MHCVSFALLVPSACTTILLFPLVVPCLVALGKALHIHILSHGGVAAILLTSCIVMPLALEVLSIACLFLAIGMAKCATRLQSVGYRDMELQ